jgi:hypothetical protein
MILVTDLGERAAEQIVSALAALEARHRQGLFPNGLRHAIVVQAAKPAGSAEGHVPGLFSPGSRTLEVNVSLPFGATVHEFVRALHFDDQAARGQSHAAWLRAGIAALYERTDSGSGTPRAVLDWRLDPLRDGLAMSNCLTLARLLTAADAQVGDAATGEARYLLYWLQQNNQILAFYRAYVDRYDEDPTGRLALESVRGAPLAAIEKQWLAFVKGPIPGP